MSLSGIFLNGKELMYDEIASTPVRSAHMAQENVKTRPPQQRRYSVIYADPPWTYRDKALAGQRGAGCKYDLMSAEALQQLPVAQLAAPDCALFMWVTMPKLDEAFPLLQAWGFTYKTVAFTWVKRNKHASSWFWGMGRWTRANAELCLLATKGSPTRVSASVHSVIDTPIQAHSQKPTEVHHRIEQLMGEVPKIELFARRPALGWDVWGNQVEGSIQWPDGEQTWS